ncbi:MULTISPECIES: hypothetical protein [Enterobacterales]|uniref:hypothetical protein n=1 Tax=Enterobacterales TaxID=91347 RepID=UPI002ED9A676
MLKKFLRAIIGRKTEPQSTQGLFFNDNHSAFEYACEYMDCELVGNIPLPAIVLPGPEGKDPVITSSGCQRMLLKVCSNDGGFCVIADTAHPNGPRLRIGDLVCWVPFVYLEHLVQPGVDQRFGWCGFVLGTLKPTLNSSGWLGDQRFTK